MDRIKKILNAISTWLKKTLKSKNVGGVALKIVIMLVIPYVYLILCGLIFDKWLHMYNMTGFIFWSLMLFWLIAIILSVFSVIWYVKKPKEEESKPEEA